MDTLMYWLKRPLPESLLKLLRLPYHWLLARLGSLIYRQPSRELFVIAVTGTKGKSTVVELTAHLLAAAGFKVASLSTIQFRLGDTARPNRFKMTTPGRFFVQKFLRQAVETGCTHAVLELTSEGARQFRHRWIELDALIFTNLSPEHIESHGSFEKYKQAKLSILRQLEQSAKQPRYLVVNADDEHGPDFLRGKVEEKIPYSLKDLKLYTLHKDGVSLVFHDGDEEVAMRVPLPGLFNVYNALSAVTMARALAIPLNVIESAMRDLPPLRGRVEQLSTSKEAARQINVVIDYAHTPDSLEKLYQTFKDVYKIGVLGNTGGGRDTWKRPQMGALAEQYCEKIILTNEDPYDEDPRRIVEAMAAGIKDEEKLDIIMDRRLAIRTAIEECPDGGYVIVSGKGTDPFIMGPRNTRQPWDDATVAREELARFEAKSKD